MWITWLLILLAPLVHAEEIKRSDIKDQFWIEAAAGVSPDSGVFHGEGSAVADRRDITIRYQIGTLGLVANRHTLVFDSELDQEGYNVHNTIYGAGFTVRVAPFGEKSGILGGSHFVAHVMVQTGRSDYHYFEGPGGGTKSEVKADVAKATGFGGGADFYFPAVFGLWLFGGGGWETNNFDYKITTDPNDDGKVNIRQTFSYLRGGLSFSF